MRLVGSILLSVGLLWTGSAVAQELQSSEDIVKFFEEDASLGPTRGICVGTEEQCRGKTAPPSGLDMLVNFELDSDALTPDARAKLTEFVKALKDERLKSLSFVVEGHTDSRPYVGKGYDNFSLSHDRADAVRKLLLSGGVPDAKIEAIKAYADRKPRLAQDPNHFSNRRVTILLPFKTEEPKSIGDLPSEELRESIEGVFKRPIEH